MKQKWVSIFFVVMALVLTTGGCKKSETPDLDVIATLLSVDGCKQFLSNSQADDGTILPGPYQDCLDWHFDGNGTLVLQHISSGFNCCPGEITSNVFIEGNTITVEELEETQGCKCLCLFDLTVQLQNLPAGTWIVRVLEPYVQETDTVMEFTIQLTSSASSGSVCYDRDYYPWL